MKRITRTLRLGLLVLALLGLIGTAPAAAGGDGGPVDHQYIGIGTQTGEPFDLADCVIVGSFLIECPIETTGSLFGVPFWLGALSSSGTAVVDLGSTCTDFRGRTATPSTGSGDGVIVSGGSELHYHFEYWACATADVGGHSVGTRTFTGGTGVFEGATGSVLVLNVTDAPAATASLSVGTLTV